METVKEYFNKIPTKLTTAIIEVVDAKGKLKKMLCIDNASRKSKEIIEYGNCKILSITEFPNKACLEVERG